MHALELGAVNYCLTALWLAPVLLLGSLGFDRVVGPLEPRLEYRLWSTTLLAQALLPLAALLLSSRVFPVLHHALAGLSGGAEGVTVQVLGARSAGAYLLSGRSIHIICACFALCAMAAALRLLRSAFETRRVLRQARTVSTTLTVAGLRDVRLAVSREVATPMTAGILHHAIVLPLAWRRQLSDGDLQAALLHEAAHVERADFAKNLLHRVVTLGVAFHPAVWMAQARLAGSRETICDALAAGRMGNRQSYAHSLLRLASAAVERRATFTQHCGVGIFDGNVLEKRLMKLTTQMGAPTRAKRAVQLMAMVLFFAAVGSSAFGWRGVMSQDEANAVRVSPGVIAGQLVSKFNPVYPPDAKAAGIQGTVVLHAIIGKDGSISNLTVISGPPELQAAALDAVKQWQYKPYMLNGEPTAVSTEIHVNFALRK